MAGTFRPDSTFTIKGHGLFVRGTIVAGTVQAGGMLAIPCGHGNTRDERITRVELGEAPDSIGDIKRLVGLQLGALPPADVPIVRRLLASGMDLVMADPEPGYVLPAPTRATGDTWSP